MGRRRKQRPHRPHEIGPRIFWAGRWAGVDLRPWGMGRLTMRDPTSAGWPRRGKRTELREVAEQWLPAYIALVRDRSLGKRRPQRLDDALDAWLEYRRHRVAPGTLAGNETAARRLLEVFGPAREVESITAGEVQRIFDGLLAEGYARTTLKTERIIFGTFFRWAGSDIISRTDTPAPIERDIFTWSDAQIEAIREAADRVDKLIPHPMARLAVEVGLATGCRQQEMFALDWSAFDFAEKSVRITRQLSRYGSGYTILKGKLSRTALVLPSFWDWYQPKAGLLLSSGGRPVDYRHGNHLAQRILDTANLNAPGRGWHDLRRTYGRLFLEAGGFMDELQRSLGHKSIVTTERSYGHFGVDKAVEFARGRIYGEGRLRVVR